MELEDRTKEEIIGHAIKNVLAQNHSEYNTIENCVEAIKRDGLYRFIGQGFVWNGTPEGINYWEAIYNEIEHDLYK